MSETRQCFQFRISGFPNDTFHVVRFTGEEGLSRLYRFDITLYAQDTDLDFEKALSNTAAFTILGEKGGIPFHGILERFEQLSHSGPHSFYRAILVPKAWWLTQTTHNQIFLDMKNSQFLGKVFEDAGLKKGIDFSIDLQEDYPTWDYVCQYNETHLAFASRWMERGGLYFYFEQGDSGEIMVVTDTLTAHTAMPQGETLRYSTPSSLQDGHEEEIVTEFILSQARLPKSVRLRDYNYETPSLELQADAQVKENGQGVHYVYGLHFKTRGQGAALAHLRAESFRSREKLYSGVSTVPFLRPGYTFTLENHFRGSFNQKYQTIAIRHEGSQEAWLVAGLGLNVHARHGDGLSYRNAFRAIPAATQFRPEPVTPRPAIAGTLPAKVDAEGSGQYAEVDAKGRYKLRMPFDTSDRSGGHATAWVRMAQPYAGAGYGMHMPLHKGAEVLVGFLEGDPDRPVIVGAVPNPETQSPVTSANQTKARVATSGGNLLSFEDQDGSQSILLFSPVEGSYMRIGSASSDGEGSGSGNSGGSGDSGDSSGSGGDGGDGGDAEEKGGWFSEDGLKLYTGGPLGVQCKLYTSLTLGDSNEIVVGALTDNVLGWRHETTVGLTTELHLAAQAEFGPENFQLRAEARKAVMNQEKVIENVMEMLGQKESLAEAVEEMITQKTSTLASKTDLIVQCDQTAAELSMTLASKTELSASKKEVLAQCTQTVADKTATLATKTEVLANMTKMHNEVQELSSEVTHLHAEVNRISSSINDVSESKVNVCGEYTSL